MSRHLVCALALFLCAGTAGTAEPTAAERGKKALLERNFTPPVWSLSTYQSVWKQWGTGRKEPPADYDSAFRARYGLHPAPYPNHGLPMGLRQDSFLGLKGLSVDCLVCHGGSVLGKSYVGLGNSSLEIHALFEELTAAGGRSVKLPFQFSNVRGTSEAGAMAVYLIDFRNPDLSLRKPRHELDLRDDLCEDVPAWWLLKKKKTMYYTGGADARSVRSIMQFMMSPLNSAEVFATEEATFRDVQAYILSLEPPKYPFPVDQEKAALGARLFRLNCARCHGTYGANWTYPNKVIPIDEIGTDRRRFEGISEAFGRYYNRSWFAKEKPGWFLDEFPAKEGAGYQAPPLDGIWATAPYLHNGSVPTLYHVLKSEARPRIFTRSYRTDADAYDPAKVGWKFDVLLEGANPRLPPIEQRKIYDTRLPGRGNGGHTYGDHLSDDERMAVIEYLKTL